MSLLRITFISIVLLVISAASYSQNQMQDVVYLKNGSIIRGMIIEQIPNETIKIETADRNVFVYNFEEIEKITKESQTKVKNASTGSVSFGLRVNGGMDVTTGGIGYGAGASIIYIPDEDGVKYEFGLDFYKSKLIENKTELGSVSDVTKLLLFSIRTNFLFNYHPDKTGIFYLAGFGLAGGMMDWERIDGLDGTGNYIEQEEYTPIGNVVNLGVGLSTTFGLEPRLEVPLLFFYNAGNAGAFLPAVTFALGYRF